MVAHVAGHDVRGRPRRHRVAVGDAAAQQRLGGEAPEHDEVGAADVAELVRKRAEGAAAPVGVCHVVVLLVPGERRRVSAGEAERAIAEDPLGVGDVAENLPHAPLVRRGAEVAILLAQSADPALDLGDLPLQ